jgi:hypothetical protein
MATEHNRHCRRRAGWFAAPLICAALAVGQADGDRQLEAAIYREVVVGDLKGAIEKYRAILGQEGVPHATAAGALFHMAQCYEKLGQPRQAHEAYARVAREYESETGIAGVARERAANWREALPGPRNLNFEEGEPGKAPPGWTLLTLEKVTGNLVELRRKGCHSGIGCAMLIAPATAPGQVGNLMQSFLAAGYRGKTVRLRASLRVEAGAPGDRANMWLQEDRPNGKQGLTLLKAISADLGQQSFAAPDWTICELTGKVHPDAQFLRFGFSSIGNGRVWIDNVSFEVVYGANE